MGSIRINKLTNYHTNKGASINYATPNQGTRVGIKLGSPRDLLVPPLANVAQATKLAPAKIELQKRLQNATISSVVYDRRHS